MRVRPLEAGSLKHRIRIERLVESEDPAGTGQPVLTPALLGDRWASIEPLDGRELEHAQQINAEVNYRLIIRYWAEVTSKDRVVFKGRIFNIKAVLNPGESNEQMHLMCAEST